jgi:hypothetical protein
MAAKKPAKEPEEPSRAAGGCVLVVLGGGTLAVVFAASPEAGVLAVWVVGALAVWRAARRRIGTDLALPSPTVAPSRNDVSADELRKAARAAYDPNGVMCIVHAPLQGSDAPPGAEGR